MKDEIEIKKLKGLAVSVLLLFSLFLPFGNEKVLSYSLLDFTSGKIIAILLITVYLMFLKDIAKVFLKTISFGIISIFIYKIIDVVLYTKIDINISTVSLMLILLFSLLFIVFLDKE